MKEDLSAALKEPLTGGSPPRRVRFRRLLPLMFAIGAVTLSLVLLFATVRVTDLSLSSRNDKAREELDALMKRVYDDQTHRLALNSDTLQNADMMGVIQRATELEHLPIHDAKCEVQQNSLVELHCTGKLSVFSVEDGLLTFVAQAITDPQAEDQIKLVAAIEVELSHGWSPKTGLPKSIMQSVPSWMNTVEFSGSVGGTVVVANAAFTSLAGSSYQRGVRAFVKGAFSNSALFALDRLSSKFQNAHFDFLLFVPFAAPAKDKALPSPDFERSVAQLNFDFTVMAASQSMSVVVNRMFTSNPAIQLELNAQIPFNKGQPLDVKLRFDWTGKPEAVLKAMGKLNKPWVNPLGADWLTIQSIVIDATVDCSIKDQCVLTRFNADGSGIMAIKPSKGSLEVDLHLDLPHQGMKDFTAYVHAKWDPMRMTATEERLVLANLVETVSGSEVPSSSAIHDLKAVAEAEIVLTTYDHAIAQQYLQLSSGMQVFARRGVNLFADVTLREKSQMAYAFTLVKNGIDFSNLHLAFGMAVNILDAPVRDVYFSLLCESLQLLDHLQLSRIELIASVKDLTTISMSSVLVADYDALGGAVSFLITADINVTLDQLRLTGGLASAWEHPFKLRWLRFPEAKVTLAIDRGTVSLFQIDARGEAAFSKVGTYLTVHAQALQNFKEFHVQLVGEVKSLGETVRTITAYADPHNPAMINGVPLLPSTVNDVQTSVDDLSFAHHEVVQIDISTYPDGSIRRGLTVTAKVIVTGKSITNALQPLHLQLDKLEFDFSIYVPIFSVLPGEIEFSLRAPYIGIRPNLRIARSLFTLSLTTPPRVSLAGGVEVLFKKQPDWITFAVKGEFSAAGTVTITGALEGLWHNVLGLKGLNMGNAWIAIGFGPEGLNAFGLGGTTQLGATVLQLNGYVDLVNLEELYIMANVEHLSMRDIAEAYNQMMPEDRKKIDIQAIPDVLNLKKVYFQLAPHDGSITIDHTLVTFREGMVIDADITLLAIDEIKFKLLTQFDAKRVPDFQLYFDFRRGDFPEQWSKIMESIFSSRELRPPVTENFSFTETNDWIHDLSYVIPQLREIEIPLFALSDLAAGKLPVLNIKIEYMGKIVQFSSQMKLSQLVHRLGDLILQGVIDLKTVLNVPECVVDWNCPNHMRCDHRQAPWKCVTACPEGSGWVPIFGCVKCFSSAECHYDGSSGSCCDHGQCRAAASGEFCGMCDWGRQCSSPDSGCIFGFCRKCITRLDCYWKGASGHRCNREGHCYA